MIVRFIFSYKNYRKKKKEQFRNNYNEKECNRKQKFNFIKITQ